MSLEMTEGGPPLTMARVSVLEHELGIRLPEGYKSFLLLYNGGKPNPEFFPIHDFDKASFGGIHYFFGMDRSVRSSNVDWNYRTYHGRIPPELLPIAGDGSGNIICLAFRGRNEGMVYYWDHDNEHSPPTYDNLYLIAETFDKFLDSIHFEDISAEVAKSVGKSIPRPH